MILFWAVLLKAVTGLVIGFSIGMTGIGGGILVLPALVILFDMSATVAVGTANLYSFLTKFSATYHHWKQKTIAVRICLYILAGAVPANVGIAFLITDYVGDLQSDPAALAAMQESLKQFIGALILVSAAFIIWDLVSRHRHGAERKNALHEIVVKSSFREGLSAAILGALVGGLIAATSVGGGVLLIPLLMIVFGLSSVQTVGSSILIGSVLTLISSVVYAAGSQVDWSTGIIMAVGAFIGVPIGSRLSKKIPDRTLQIIVSGIILVAGGLMLMGNGH
ncbi:MAG: sulfite exporter TauE/SafE family protein [Candidatus Latescibacteria bacterium]|jgi:uncharacterized protein|nr:sulfite exporter TauE/SafE family protein [Candidatus Latescibacterota bacterium]